MKKLFLWFALSLTLSGKAQQVIKSLSMSQAVNMALVHYPSIQSKQSMVNAYKARVTETRNQWLPALILNEQVNIGTDNSLIGAYFPMGVIPSASGGTRPKDNTAIALGNIATIAAQWEIYNFGKYHSNITEANAALQINENSLQNEMYSIQLATSIKYLQLLKYRLLLNIQLKNIQRTQLIKTAISAYVKNGLRAGVDTSIAASELSKDRLTYIELLNTYNSIKGGLSVLTGLDTLLITPDTSLNRQLGNLLSLKPASDTGFLQQPMLKYYQSVYEDNMAQLNVIQKNYLPKVYLMATGWMRGSSIRPTDVYDNTLSNGLNYSRYNYLAGAVLSYNLTDSRTTRLKANEQRFKADAALQDYYQQKIELSQAYKNADESVQASAKMLAEIPVQLKAASDGYIQKLALYNSGLANIVDLTNALYILNRAETDAVLTNDTALKSIIQRAYMGNFLSQTLNNMK